MITCSYLSTTSRAFRALLSFIFLTLAASCATDEKPVIDLIVKHDAVVTVSSGKSRTVRAGKSVKVDVDGPITVDSPGFVSTMILPSSGSGRSLTIDPLPLDVAGGDKIGRAMNANLARVIPRMLEVQRLLAQSEVKKALTKASALVSDYPELTYLLLLRATCLALSGDYVKAKDDVEEVVSEFPGDGEAKAFLRDLENRISKSKTKGG